MAPVGTSPKHHILFGWPVQSPPPARVVLALTRAREACADGCACAGVIARGAALLACPPCAAPADGAEEDFGAPAGCGEVCAAGQHSPTTAAGELVASVRGRALAAAEFSAQERATARAAVEEAICPSAAPAGGAVAANSSRQRRLIHWTAEEMGLEHWSERGAGKHPNVVRVRARAAAA